MPRSRLLLHASPAAWAAFLLIAGLPALFRPAHAQSGRTDEPSGAAAVRARVEKAIADEETPGAVVLVAHRGEVVFEEAYGFADREARRPQRIDDLFNLGSTSKPVAMTVVMTQVADGKLSLDDPVAKWFPEYGGGVLVTGEPIDRFPVIREMMAHSSGTFALKCGDRSHLSRLYMFGRTLRESAAAIAATPLAYQPGKGFCYCGPSMQVTGRIVEIETALDFDEVARTRVFAPLGMTDTLYRAHEDLSGRIAVVYDRTDEGLRRSSRNRDPNGESFILVPGGLYSTARDLARFVQAHLRGGVLDGKRILPESLILEMRRNQIGDTKMDLGDPSIGERNSAALGDMEGYGLGWILDDIGADGQARLFSHGVRTAPTSGATRWRTSPWSS